MMQTLKIAGHRQIIIVFIILHVRRGNYFEAESSIGLAIGRIVLQNFTPQPEQANKMDLYIIIITSEEGSIA